MNFRSSLFAIAFAVLFVSMAYGQWKPLQRHLRCAGLCFGDGYHKCNPGPHAEYYNPYSPRHFSRHSNTPEQRPYYQEKSSSIQHSERKIADSFGEPIQYDLNSEREYTRIPRLHGRPAANTRIEQQVDLPPAQPPSAKMPLFEYRPQTDRRTPNVYPAPVFGSEKHQRNNDAGFNW